MYDHLFSTGCRCWLVVSRTRHANFGPCVAPASSHVQVGARALFPRKLGRVSVCFLCVDSTCFISERRTKTIFRGENADSTCFQYRRTSLRAGRVFVASSQYIVYGTLRGKASFVLHPSPELDDIHIFLKYLSPQWRRALFCAVFPFSDCRLPFFSPYCH
jgi:hypothetical protein